MRFAISEHHAYHTPNPPETLHKPSRILQTHTRRLRWGVLSTARIARQKVIPAIQGSSRGVVTAIASRDYSRAKATARKHAIETTFPSYADLLNSPHVEAVYIPLPNHLHVAWAVRCLEAGKHVLCEKPIGLNTQDALRLVETSRQYPRLVAAEAFMYRHHPQWQEILRLVKAGVLGSIRSIQSAFTYFNADPTNIRNQVDIGGGGLLDIGCYTISVARHLLGREPARICCVMDRDPEFGTDRVASVLADFDGTVSMSCCSTQLHRFQQVHVLGDLGRIEIPIPFNAPTDAPTRVHQVSVSGIETIKFGAANQYALQTDAFAESVFTGSREVSSLEDALANMRAIDAAFESAKRGCWVEL